MLVFLTVMSLIRRGYCDLKGHDEDGKGLPGVAQVEHVHHPKHHQEDDGERGGQEVHCLPAKVPDVLGRDESGHCKTKSGYP
jgi:hypothetical protein